MPKFTLVILKKKEVYYEEHNYNNTIFNDYWNVQYFSPKFYCE